MAGDLYYFYESDLDKTNIKEFYDSLPSRLQAKFKASLHGIQIGEGNVLQGYRGPSNMCNGGSGDSKELKPSHGLQEIKFWWGARKDFNFILGVGTLVYTGCRTSQYFSGKLEWSSLYFDSQTGECLSHDKREAAEKLRSRARKAESKPQARSSNCDDDSEHYERWMAARDEARRDEHAEYLNSQGNQLFDQCQYTQDRDKQEEAFHASEEYDSRCKYRRQMQKAQTEINANKRFHEGNRLFDMGRFRDAAAVYHDAYVTSNKAYTSLIYRESKEKAIIEAYAVQFCHEGDTLFNQGRFKEAISRYERAINESQNDRIRQIYSANVAKAQNEIVAIDLTSQGDNSFDRGMFWEAQNKYKEADMISKVRKGTYKSNFERAQVEIDALKKNSLGDQFYNLGNFREAAAEYLGAHAKSQVYAQFQKYKANADKAQAEVDAANFNSQGDNFFKERRFNDSLSKYQLACNTSKVSAQVQKYRVNIAKAQVEIDALKLNAEGDNYFNAGRFTDAVSTYLAAYNKSQITTEKNKYFSNKNKAEGVINKLKMLDALWKQAWHVESDTKNDRSEEVKDLFQKILSESNENLKTFPGNTKFEQFKALAILKIEGNEVFNEGVQSQENGAALFAEAQELNQQEKYGRANEKFKEAKKYFQEAFEKFERGSKSDQRFAPCVGYVQDLINVVVDSIKITEQCMFSERLNKLEISRANHSGAPSCETDVTGKHINYFQHI